MGDPSPYLPPFFFTASPLPFFPLFFLKSNARRRFSVYSRHPLFHFPPLTIFFFPFFPSSDMTVKTAKTGHSARRFSLPSSPISERSSPLLLFSLRSSVEVECHPPFPPLFLFSCSFFFPPSSPRHQAVMRSAQGDANEFFSPLPLFSFSLFFFSPPPPPPTSTEKDFHVGEQRLPPFFSFFRVLFSFSFPGFSPPLEQDIHPPRDVFFPSFSFFLPPFNTPPSKGGRGWE